MPSSAPVVTIRLAGPGDVTALVELMTRTFRETYDEALFGDSRTADVEAYVTSHFGIAHQRREIADSRLATLLAEADGALAGYAQVCHGSATGCRAGARPVELARFYVDRPWHRRGVARALMDAVLAASPAADPLWLGVFERNARARAFYEKCGFVPAGRATFRMGDDVQDDCILVLDAGRTGR